MKRFVGICRTRSIFKSAANMHNVSNIDTQQRNELESNPRPLSRESVHHQATAHCEKIFYSVTCKPGGSVAEWLACWTQAQNGPGLNGSRDAVG